MSAPDAIPLLAGRALCYRRGGRTILDGVDLEVHAGEHVAVTGPSGSGKTTLLTLLAGVDRPDSGTVRLDGAALDHPRPEVGLVLQGYGLIALLTAAENVEASLRAAGVAAREAVRRAAEALEWVRLGSHSDHLVEDLSGGQQQRVAVARCLALAPRVLLADEPTAEQDPAHRALVVERLLHRDGTAVVIATHDPEIAARCDRVVEIHRPEAPR